MRAPIRDPFLEQLREQGFTFVEKHPLKGCIDGGYVRDGVYVSWVYERGIRIDVRIPSLQETTASSNESGFGLASSGGAKFLAARQLLYLNASNGGQILEQVVTLASTGERLLREAGAAKRKPRK